ncbi:MAG: TldD/PmbA family protein [Thermoplasmata archaeon]|jgi:PmbA protein|nr:TldD/PmbA family protein [Thermoplasmata archaeon]
MSAMRELAVDLVEAARTAGADDAVAEVMDTTISQVRYSNKVIDATNWWTEKNAYMFVAVGKRTIATDFRDLSQALSMMPALVDMARKSPENETFLGIAKGKFKYPRSRLDKKIVYLRDPARHVHDAISGAESEGAIDVGGTLYVRHYKTALASSGGPLAEDETASMDLSVRAFSQPEASGHAVSCVPRLAQLKAKETGRRAGELAVMAKDPVQGEQGKTDLVMEPMFLGGLVLSTSGMMSALMVDIGMSMYAKKIGKKVASEAVTFVDDPRMESTSMRAFDHEGVPTRRNVIIKDGVLKTYLHSASTAKKYRTKTTGSCGPLLPTAGLAGDPTAFHPVVVPGDWSIDEVVKDTKHGLYVNNTWYTRYQNYGTGEFSTIPRDAILRIENGEIVGAVKNVRLSDNMLNVWKSIDTVSKETQEVYWWDEASPPSTLPTVRVKSMNMTRSA